MPAKEVVEIVLTRLLPPLTTTTNSLEVVVVALPLFRDTEASKSKSIITISILILGLMRVVEDALAAIGRGRKAVSPQP